LLEPQEVGITPGSDRGEDYCSNQSAFSLKETERVKLLMVVYFNFLTSNPHARRHVCQESVPAVGRERKGSAMCTAPRLELERWREEQEHTTLGRPEDRRSQSQADELSLSAAGRKARRKFTEAVTAPRAVCLLSQTKARHAISSRYDRRLIIRLGSRTC
jgi:hypothetical protein